MEVLFEYRGSRRQLDVAEKESITRVVTNELRRVGKPRAQVFTASDDLPSLGRGEQKPDIYLLQRWSSQWDCYVDVAHYNEVSDGDKLAVVAKPKPPSLFSLLCCCASDNSYRVGGSAKMKIPKSEEIQALEYKFRAESEEGSILEESYVILDETHAKPGISEGEQFVRAETGRAAWKLVNKPEEDDPIVAGRSEEEQQEEDKRQDENRGEFGGIQEENEGGENEEMKHAEEEEIATSQEDSHNQLEDAVELSAPPIAEHTADANVPQEDTKVMCVDTMPPQTEGNDVLGPCEIADSQGNTSGVPADTNVEPDELIDDEGKAVEAECWSNQGDNDGAIATTANTE